MVCCDVVIGWSLWFVVVTWQTGGGIPVVSEFFCNERWGADHDSISGNDERQHHCRLLFGGRVAHGDMALSIPSMWPGLIGDMVLQRHPCFEVFIVPHRFLQDP